MTDKTRKIASFRQREREELFPDIKKVIEKLEADCGMSFFPYTLRQVALFLRFVRVAHRESDHLVNDFQKTLTYYQGKRIVGIQADTEMENWKTSAGRTAATLFNELGLR